LQSARPAAAQERNLQSARRRSRWESGEKSCRHDHRFVRQNTTQLCCQPAHGAEPCSVTDCTLRERDAALSTPPPPPQSMPTSGGSAAQEWQERFLVAERVANNVSPPEVAQVSAFENNLNVNL